MAIVHGSLDFVQPALQVANSVSGGHRAPRLEERDGASRRRRAWPRSERHDPAVRRAILVMQESHVLERAVAELVTLDPSGSASITDWEAIYISAPPRRRSSERTPSTTGSPHRPYHRRRRSCRRHGGTSISWDPTGSGARPWRLSRALAGPSPSGNGRCTRWERTGSWVLAAAEGHPQELTQTLDGLGEESGDVGPARPSIARRAGWDGIHGNGRRRSRDCLRSRPGRPRAPPADSL